MLLIPAIDLKDGKCVRLRQGKMEDETVFGDDGNGGALGGSRCTQTAYG